MGWSRRFCCGLVVGNLGCSLLCCCVVRLVIYRLLVWGKVLGTVIVGLCW